jgi:hypothetical protein
LIIEVHQQVPGLLGHPLSRRVRGDPGQVHPPGAVLDEEQHVQTAQEHRIDAEEVHREDRLRLGFQECPPGLPGSPGRGIDAGIFEDLPYRRRGQLPPEPGQLTMDTPVSPPRVVPGHLQDQRPYRLRGSRPAGGTARIGPVPPDQGIANARPLHPLPKPITDPDQVARLGIRRRERLGGILHEYEHAS